MASASKIQKRYRINQYIRISPIRLIDEKGQNLGIMETAEALRLAQERRLDLIEIVPKTRPPICKLMDSGKFKYEHEKQIRAQKVKQKEVEVKSIRIGFTTGKHDLEMRAEQIQKFFEKGHKAKIDMVLRGREKSHRDLARKIFDDFLALIPDMAFDMAPKKTPQGFVAVIRKK
ncbi:MAG: translation initiation factor IF-3 [bacterium]|nr:translation initiation factor IF-3 [bacterium]